MKKIYALSLAIILISLGTSGQDFEGLKPSEKLIKPDRARSSHQMLDSYQFLREHSLLKSAAEDSLSLDTAQIQYYLGEDQYLPVYNQRLYYDADGNLARMQDELLNAQSYVWETSSRTDLAYDPNGNLTQILNQEWDATSSSFVPTDRSVFTYNKSNYLIRITEYDWEESESQLALTSKMDITLDENNLRTQAVVYLWLSGTSEWLEDLKYEYSYTVNDALLEELEYIWDRDLSDWINSWKALLSYNQDDQLIEKEEFEWDTEGELWFSIWKSQYSHDAEGNVQERLDSEYIPGDEMWQEAFKGEYTYDDLNNPLSEQYSTRDENAGQLASVAKYEYIYDQSSLLPDLLTPSPEWFFPDYREQIVSKPLGYISYEYNSDASDFEIYFHNVYLYNPAGFPLGIRPGKAQIAVLYPNPVRESLTINFEKEYPVAEFELFDLNGRNILREQVEHGEILNLEDINDGVYLYRISAGDFSQSGKLIKK